MEFYKEYVDGGGPLAVEELNKDIKNNLQWKSEVKSYAIYNDCTFILVCWVGLSETPFTENEE